MPGTVLVLSDDLIFSSRIAATGRAVDVPVVVARSSEAALKKATATPFTLVIADLHNPGLELPVFLESLKMLGLPKVLGYGSHVDIERLKAARKAGCDWVMPRSQFVDLLESDLAKWAGSLDLKNIAADERGRNADQN
jgi:DNA-binding NarL/FixJ family response regulator